MDITQNQAIATLDDKDSAIEVLSEIYARLQEFKDERDRLIVKNIAQRVEIDSLKHDVIHSIITDNFTLNYRDSSGIDRIESESILKKKNYKIVVMKG